MTKYHLVIAILILTISTISYAHEEEDHDHQFGEKDEHEHHGDDIKDFAKKDPKDMDEQELRFYMFKQHDFDNDDRLDGIELLKNVMKHYDEKLEKYKRKRDEAVGDNDDEKVAKKEEKIKETQERMEEENVMKNIDDAEYTSVMYPKNDEQEENKL